MMLRSMRYLGSERMVLANGLGDALTKDSRSPARFVDLFCGAGIVSEFVATSSELPVLSSDLQNSKTTLAASIVKQTGSTRPDQRSKHGCVVSAAIGTNDLVGRKPRSWIAPTFSSPFWWRRVQSSAVRRGRRFSVRRRSTPVAPTSPRRWPASGDHRIGRCTQLVSRLTRWRARFLHATSYPPRNDMTELNKAIKPKYRNPTVRRLKEPEPIVVRPPPYG